MNKIISPIRIVFWALWSALCMGTAVLTRLITFSASKTVWLAKAMWVDMALLIPGVKLTSFANDKIDKTKPYVFVGNHESYLDIPCMVKTIENPIYWIVKKELKRMPFLGWYVMATDMIFIDRSNSRKAITSLKEAAKMIKGGKSIVAFPEGTRSKNGKMKPFKKGSFMLALDAGVPIVPIAIAGTGKIFPATKIEFTPGKAYTKVCDPIPTITYTKATIGELIEKVEAVIAKEKALLDNLL